METAQIQRIEVEFKIKELKGKIIKALQDFSRSQVELWRQVPVLAKEANTLKSRALGQVSGRYMLAYQTNHWPISPKDIYGLQVELQTGEFGLGRSQLCDEIELGMLDSILEALDAGKVISLLKSEIAQLVAAE